jgi:hypothetical protein
VNAQGLHSVVGGDQGVAGRREMDVDHHAERVGHQRGGLGGVDGPANDPPRVGVKDHGAVDLALAGGMSVMSVTHSRSRPSRENCRSTRSAAVTSFGTRFQRGRPESPWMPARRISKVTCW